MFYSVKTLEEMYQCLEEIDAPIALFDFLSGEMGYEAMCAQAICGKFYDDFCMEARVVALCWYGSGFLYSNVSHDQIELVDPDIAIMGNVIHRGEDRYNWLVDERHVQRRMNIAGVVKAFGPSAWIGGNPRHYRLRGFCVNPMYLESSGYTTNAQGMLQFIASRLGSNRIRINSDEIATFTPYIFGLPERPWIFLFDRNEQHRPERNTEMNHILYMKELADRFNFKLVVLSGLYPRKLPEGVIHVAPPHRDFALINVLVSNSVVFASPPCGVAETAVIYGCNFLNLSTGPYPYRDEEIKQLCTNRGLRYFGPLSDESAAEMERFLAEVSANPHIL